MRMYCRSVNALSWVAAATLASAALAGPPRARFADPNAPGDGADASPIAARVHRIVARALREAGGGRSSRGAWLGVWLAPLSASQREQIGGGARVVGVVEDGPADDAGLRRSDIIVRINDRRVGSLEEARQIVRTLRPGREVRLRIVRGSRMRTVRIRPAERPAAGIQPRRGSEEVRDQDDSQARTDEAADDEWDDESNDESDDESSDVQADAEDIEAAFEQLGRAIAKTAEEIENEDDPMAQVAMVGKLLRSVSDMLELVPMVEDWIGAELSDVDIAIQDAALPGMDWARFALPKLALFRKGTSPNPDSCGQPSSARTAGACRCGCACCRLAHDKASKAQRPRRSWYDETN